MPPRSSPASSLDLFLANLSIRWTRIHSWSNLALNNNQLTKLPKGLEKLTQLKELNLINNPNLTKAQIDALQKALPKCIIDSDFE